MTTPGKNYYVETVTKYWVGELVEHGSHFVILKNAAWIPSTGRFHEFIARGRADQMEVEPCGTALVMVFTPTAIIEWPHKLFKEAI